MEKNNVVGRRIEDAILEACNRCEALPSGSAERESEARTISAITNAYTNIRSSEIEQEKCEASERARKTDMYMKILDTGIKVVGIGLTVASVWATTKLAYSLEIDGGISSHLFRQVVTSSIPKITSMKMM